MQNKSYLAIVQCDIVKERCSGFFCEQAFNERTGGFKDYPTDKAYRTLHLSCGGCCGRAVHRKLSDLIHSAKKKDGIEKSQIAVHLSSCITKDSYHGPPCPHLDYLKTMIGGKLGLDIVEDTSISKKAEERRQAGKYQS